MAENQEVVDFIRVRLLAPSTLTIDAFLQTRSAAEAQLASTLISNTTSRKGTLCTSPPNLLGLIGHQELASV